MAADDRKPFRLSLSGWILLALIGGVAFGLFFGEATAFLQVLADGFIRLLQMAVLPYVTVSLVAGLGRLSYREAGFVARRAGLILLLLWGMALAMVAAMPVAYPRWESASFFSTTLIEARESFDFVGLYIPANPFNSLAQNAVPAVVLFCIALGVALIGVRGRETLIENLSVLSDALSRITTFVVYLTPVGVFAIAASAAGTMTIEDFGRLQIYVLTYVAVALFMALWALPGLVAALTPVRHRDLLRVSRDALVTAFSTGSLFVVLPLLAENTKELIGRRRPDAVDADSVIDVIIPVSFNFPHAGKLFALGFVLFAAWFAGASLPLGDYPMLLLSGLFSLFGSVNVAVPFLLDTFRIPADMFQLFLAMGIINGRFATLMAAMHTLVLAVLGTCAVEGVLGLRWGRLARYLLLTVGLGALVLGGMRWLLTSALDSTYVKYELITERGLSREPVPAKVYTDVPKQAIREAPGGSRLERILARDVLRVGYLPDRLPFAYLNDRGELVGLDIDLAHQLARELGVSLEFIPFEPEGLLEGLETGLFDIAGGMAATTTRSKEVWFSAPYLDFTIAFVVKDHRRAEFGTRDAILRMEKPRIGVPRSRYYRDRLRQVLPRAEVVLLDSERQFFEELGDDLDAMLHAAEVGAAWTLLYPAYAVAVPQPVVAKGVVAFPLPRGDEDLENLINTWIELKRSDGTLDALYRYWILGRDERGARPRWSVVRDVLHWVD